MVGFESAKMVDDTSETSFAFAIDLQAYKVPSLLSCAAYTVPNAPFPSTFGHIKRYL